MSKKDNSKKAGNSNPKPDQTRQGRGRDRVGDKPNTNSQGGGRMRTKEKRSGQDGDS